MKSYTLIAACFLLCFKMAIASLPVVSTDSITNITATTAIVWGNVISDGGFPVTERGVVYSHTNPNPVIGSGIIAPGGIGTGLFFSELTNLTANYIYYVRAYAINQEGTSYGTVINFTSGGITIMTEGNGMISKLTGQTNPNGAMIFNGQEWIVNATWAHKYFIDNATGERLKEVYVNIVPAGVTDSAFNMLRYYMGRLVYSYSYPAKDSGVYSYTAIQYWITDTITGKEIVLRSRGTGNGTGSTYFDIYIQDDISSGVSSLITAIRNDPFWFSYHGVDMEFALGQASATDSLTGEFPSLNGWYFLDENNGADMGGKSYHFHTGEMDSSFANTSDFGSSYPVDFAIRYMDEMGQVREIAFTPSLISEVYSPYTNVSENDDNEDFLIDIYPNPFSSSTKTTIELKEASQLFAVIFDENGREIARLADARFPPGIHQFQFSRDDRVLSPGIYSCRIMNGSKFTTRKIICVDIK